MSLDLGQMIDEFYKYFLDLYHQKRAQQPPEAIGGGAADNAAPSPFLAFNTVGTPITPEMFKLQDGSFFVQLVTEQFSLLANTLPELDGYTIKTAGLLTADEAYGALLAQAQPLTPADMASLGAIRGPAEQAFAITEAPLVHGGGDYHATLPTPPNWPLPEADDVWVTQSFTQKETKVVAAPQAPAPPHEATAPLRMTAWRWRVAPPALAGKIGNLAQLEAAVSPAPRVPSPQMAARVAMLRAPLLASTTRRLSKSTPVAAVLSPPVRRGLAAAVIGRPPEAPLPRISPIELRADMLHERLLDLREHSQPQSVTSRSLTLSFDYCLVTAHRPWLSGAFLTARNWYVPRYHAGEIASGTGTGECPFEVIPTAALCVRKLTISAEWSAEETAALANFVKFGPFSLVGRSINATSNSLVCPGIQIIGWVFEPLPRLPPNSDPALA